jgi:hypothetical protein
MSGESRSIATAISTRVPTWKTLGDRGEAWVLQIAGAEWGSGSGGLRVLITLRTPILSRLPNSPSRFPRLFLCWSAGKYNSHRLHVPRERAAKRQQKSFWSLEMLWSWENYRTGRTQDQRKILKDSRITVGAFRLAIAASSLPCLRAQTTADDAVAEILCEPVLPRPVRRGSRSFAAQIRRSEYARVFISPARWRRNRSSYRFHVARVAGAPAPCRC